jgi:hypothetical protein
LSFKERTDDRSGKGRTVAARGGGSAALRERAPEAGGWPCRRCSYGQCEHWDHSGSSTAPSARPARGRKAP